MRRLALATSLLLIVTAAAQETFFSESIEVRVTNVDVVVRGRDGKPITGLKPEDFELYEDGVRKDISNFAEMHGGPQGTLTQVPSTDTTGTMAQVIPDMRRRDITIFVDNAVLQPSRRNAIFPHLQRFVETNVRPGDTVGIVTWRRALKLELEPTSDRTAVAETIKRLAVQPTFASELPQGKEQFYQALSVLIRTYKAQGLLPPWFRGVIEARSYAEQALQEARQRVEAIKSLIAWRRGVEGRKILVLITSEITTNPGEEAFLYLDAIRENFSAPGLPAITESHAFRIPGLVEEVTSVANSAGVAIYPIDASGKTAGIIDRDASAVVPLTATGIAPEAALMPTLQPIALETGGVALSGSDNWQYAFDTIASDLDSYYSLGYRSTGVREDRLKRIQVKLKNKKGTVRTRSAIIERSVGSEMQDAVAANLFHPAAKNDLAIKVSAGAKKQEAENFIVPITITIPMDKMTLVPEGTDLTGKFALYAAFLRNDGAVSKVAQQPQSFRFPADSLKKRKDLKVTMDVTAENRVNILSIGVMDEMSKATGFASAKLE